MTLTSRLGSPAELLHPYRINGKRLRGSEMEQNHSGPEDGQKDVVV